MVTSMSPHPRAPTATSTSRSSLVLVIIIGLGATVAASAGPTWLHERASGRRLDAVTRLLGAGSQRSLDAQLARMDALAGKLKAMPADMTELAEVTASAGSVVDPGLFETMSLVGPWAPAPARPAADDIAISFVIGVRDAGLLPETMTLGSRVNESMALLGLDPVPGRSAGLQLLQVSPAKLPQRDLLGPDEATDRLTSVGSVAWTLARPVPGVGWVLAPLRLHGLGGLARALDHGGELTVQVLAARRGDTGDDTLIGEVRPSSASRATRSRSRTTVLSRSGEGLVLDVIAPAGFAVDRVPSPWTTAVIGLLGTTIATLIAASRLRRRRDATAARLMAVELALARALARTDALTGLGNRLALNERLDSMFAVAEEPSVSILLCDLDRFKVINDSRGHDAGDQVLVEVARRLGQLKGDCGVYRLGGDEFVIVVADAAIEDVVAIAEQVVAELVRPFSVGCDAVVIGSSVGLAGTTGPLGVDRSGADRSVLLRDADVAMYAAKRGGGNRMAVADAALRAEGGGRLDMELALREALVSGGFEAWYQPIVGPDREIRALEALIRWNHPQRGLLTPGEFLPVAKEAGLLAELSTVVLSRACRDVARWNAERASQGMGPLLVHVNCVEEQLMDSGFPEVVGSYLRASGLPPEDLLLEISEETAMDRLPADLPTLHQLRYLGVRFSLDDFGFGNSSLTMVRQLGDLAELKLDKSIVDSFDGPAAAGADLAVARAIVDFAHGQGIAVVAEGVETQTQFDVLRSLGVELFQGYLFHRPAPATRLETVLVPRTELSVH